MSVAGCRPGVEESSSLKTTSSIPTSQASSSTTEKSLISSSTESSAARTEGTTRKSSVVSVPSKSDGKYIENWVELQKHIGNHVGQGYFKVGLAQYHPGVVGRDTNTLTVQDKLLNELLERMQVTANNSAVQVNGYRSLFPMRYVR